MLNILLSIFLMCVSVLTFFFTYKLNKVEQTFLNFNASMVSTCVCFNTLTDKYYFQRTKLYDLVTYYFDENLEHVDYKLKLSFREDDLSTTFSSTPNIVQIDINARILFDNVYSNNVRFTLHGREISEDWWSTF